MKKLNEKQKGLLKKMESSPKFGITIDPAKAVEGAKRLSRFAFKQR